MERTWKISEARSLALEEKSHREGERKADHIRCSYKDVDEEAASTTTTVSLQ
jgi:hypothetical protein